MNFSHPVRITFGQIVVDRNDVNALPFERVEVRRQGRDERFPFARHHFGDLAFVKRAPADHLHVVVAQAQNATPGFAADGERFFEQIVERFAGGEALAEEERLFAQLFVAHRLIFRLESVDRLDARLNFLQRSRVRRTEQRRDSIFHPTRDAAEKIADALKGILQIHIKPISAGFPTRAVVGRSKIRNVAETAVGRLIIKRSPTRSPNSTRNVFAVLAARKRALFSTEILPQISGSVQKEKKL